LLVDVVDVTLRLLAFITLAEYLQRSHEAIPQINEFLGEKLEKPPMSHWRDLLHSALPALGGLNHGYTVPEITRIFDVVQRSPPQNVAVEPRLVLVNDSWITRRRSMPPLSALIHLRNVQAHKLAFADTRAEKLLGEYEPLIDDLVVRVSDFFSHHALYASDNEGRSLNWMGLSAPQVAPISLPSLGVFVCDPHGTCLALDPFVQLRKFDERLEIVLLCAAKGDEVTLESSFGLHPERAVRSRALVDLCASKATYRRTRDGSFASLVELRQFAALRSSEALRALVALSIDPDDPRVVVPTGLSETLQEFEYDKTHTSLFVASASGAGRTTWIARHTRKLSEHHATFYYRGDTLHGELLSRRLSIDILGARREHTGDLFEALDGLRPTRVFVVLDDLHLYAGPMRELILDLAGLLRAAHDDAPWFRLIVGARTTTLAPYANELGRHSNAIFTPASQGSSGSTSLPVWYSVPAYTPPELARLYELHREFPTGDRPRTAFHDLDPRWHSFLQKPSFLRVILAAFHDAHLPSRPHAENVMTRYEEHTQGSSLDDPRRVFIDRLTSLIVTELTSSTDGTRAEELPVDDLFRRDANLDRLRHSTGVYDELIERDVLCESLTRDGYIVRFVHRPFLVWKLSQHLERETEASDRLATLAAQASHTPLLREAAVVMLVRHRRESLLEEEGAIGLSHALDVTASEDSPSLCDLAVDTLDELTAPHPRRDVNFRESLEEMRRVPSSNDARVLLILFERLFARGEKDLAAQVVSTLRSIVVAPAAAGFFPYCRLCVAMVAHEALLDSARGGNATQERTSREVIELYVDAVRGLPTVPLAFGQAVVALALEHFCYLLDQHGETEAWAVLTDALARLKGHEDTRIRWTRARLLVLIARKHVRRVGDETAHSMVTEALTIARGIHSLPLQAHCLFTMSHHAWKRNDGFTARALAEDARRMLDGVRDDETMARLQGTLAVWARQERNVRAAVEHAREHLKLFRRLRHPDLSTPLINLATFLGEAGDFEESHQRYGEAREFCRMQGQVSKIAITWTMEAVLFIRAGQAERAQQALAQALGASPAVDSVRRNALWLQWNLNPTRTRWLAWLQIYKSLDEDDPLPHLERRMFPIDRSLTRGELDRAFELIRRLHDCMSANLQQRPEDWETPLLIAVRLAEALAARMAPGDRERLVKLARMADEWLLDPSAPNAPAQKVRALAEENVHPVDSLL
jgi:tetratricopeptide (TPR) repeat protein